MKSTVQKTDDEKIVDRELKYLAAELLKTLPSDREQGLRVISYLSELARGFLYRNDDEGGTLAPLILFKPRDVQS